MAIHARDEVEAAFRVYRQAGAVREDRDAWTRLDWPASPAWATPGGRK